MSRIVVAGVIVGLAAALTGCSEGNKLTLAEMERLRRDVDKQMRLVREQNEQINSKLNVVKAKMDTIETVYIPAVNTSLDSVSRKPDEVRDQIINDVNNRLESFREDYKAFKEALNTNVNEQNKNLSDAVQTRISDFEKTLNQQKKYVDFVLTQQDSVNREFANRIDKRPWYKSILGDWEDRQRQGQNNP